MDGARQNYVIDKVTIENAGRLTCIFVDETVCVKNTEICKFILKKHVMFLEFYENVNRK